MLTTNKVPKKEVVKVWCGKFSVMSHAALSHIYGAWGMDVPHLAILKHDAQVEPYCDVWCTASDHKLMPAQHWAILCHNDAWCTLLCTALRHTDAWCIVLNHVEPFWYLVHSIKPYWCLLHIFELLMHQHRPILMHDVHPHWCLHVAQYWAINLMPDDAEH